MKLDDQEIQTVILAVAKARAQGRPLVPLVGNGLSVESGVPTIFQLVHYLADLRAYVEKEAYLPRDHRGRKDYPLIPKFAHYKKQLRLFIDDFNWPSWNDLIEGLWAWDAESQSQVGDPRAERAENWDIDAERVRQLDEFAHLIHPERYQALAGLDGGPSDRSWRWDAVAEWTDLVRHVTEFKDDHASRLFTRFLRGRRPSLGHSYLAFLARLCSIRLYLSVPLGDLLEQALVTEGVAFRTYPLHDGRMPAPEVVRTSIAVLKLFGDTARPVLGEQYESSVDTTFVERLEQSLPQPRPLLLVIGSSGSGRRIMDIVERAFLKKSRTPEEQDDPDVIWLHYEKNRPPGVLRWEQLYQQRVLAACVDSPGLFLRHLYAALTSRYHSSSEPYDALERRPTPLSADPPIVAGNPNEVGIKEHSNGSLFVFDSLRPVDYGGTGTTPDVAKVSPLAPTASARLIEWVNEREAFIPIWVDLEKQYTLQGVVATILDQCRLHDPEFSPTVLPLDPDAGEQTEAARKSLDAIQKAARRLGQTLRRNRFALALDGLEMLSWSPSAHHGITSGKKEVARTTGLLQSVVQLLVELHKDKQAMKSSRLAISVNWPAGRHNKAHEERVQSALKDHLALLKKDCHLEDERIFLDRTTTTGIPLEREANRFLVRAADVIEKQLGLAPPGADGNNAADLMLLVLSCFRRTRGLVSMRSILGPLLAGLDSSVPLSGIDKDAKDTLGPYASVDTLLQEFVSAGYFIPLEGGLFWMKRPIRDRVYSQNSSATTTEMIAAVFDPAADRSQRELTLGQLILLVLHHDRIARYYYTEVYAQTKDPLAFFEYVYHRISSIRYLTKLDLLLHHEWKDADKTLPPRVDAVCQRLAKLLPRKNDYLNCDRDDQHKDEPVPPDWLANPVALRQRVQERRNDELRSLRIAWTGANDWLQSQVPAEQLISWYRWILEDDLPRFLTRYYANKYNSSAPSSGKTVADPSGRDAFAPSEESKAPQQTCAELDKPVEKNWRDLREFLYEQWARCTQERGDANGLVRLCEAYFKATTKELRERRKSGQIKDKSRCRAFWELITAGRTLRRKNTDPATIPWEKLFAAQPDSSQRNDHPEADYWYTAFREARSRLLDLAQGLCLQADRPRDQRLLDALADVIKKATGTVEYLRSLELRADAKLREGKAAERQHHTTRRLTPEKQLRLWDQLGHIADTGLLAVRRVTASERNVPDRFPYFRYLSRFLQYRARARWSGAEDANREEKFKLAYRDLEMARSRDEMYPSRTAQAQIDLAAAECALHHATHLLREATPKTQPAIAKVDAADGYLTRALNHLQHGRRNVIWWRDFFRIRAIYKVRRNECRLARLGLKQETFQTKQGAESWRRSIETDELLRDAIDRERSAFLRTLRQGLLAVGQVLDLQLDDSDESIVDVVAARRELVAGSLLFGAATLVKRARFEGEILFGAATLVKRARFEGEILQVNPSQFTKDMEVINQYVQSLVIRCDAVQDKERSDLPNEAKRRAQLTDWPPVPFWPSV